MAIEEESKEKTFHYLQQLLTNNIAYVDEENWSDHLKRELIKILEEKQIYDFRVYREIDKNRFMICINGEEPVIRTVEHLYTHQNIRRKRIPLFFIVPPILIFPLMGLGLIFASTAIIASELKLMMTLGFLVVFPFVMGALVEYLTNLKYLSRVRTLLWNQLQLMIVVIVFSLFVIREGVICLIILSPLLYLWLCTGAFLMRMFCIYLWKPKAKVYSLSIIPLLMIVWNPISPNYIYATTRNEVVINAPVQQVFDSINYIQHIQDNEIKDSPIFWMGFPKPVSGMTVKDNDGLTRKIHWQRGIYFEETITHSVPNQLLAWTYRFTPESFPKGSLDDHVEIGGQYFDLGSTDYRLEVINPTKTKLILTIDYRLSTQVNWYSKVWADYVLNEFSDVVLNVYKTRLEN